MLQAGGLCTACSKSIMQRKKEQLRCTTLQAWFNKPTSDSKSLRVQLLLLPHCRRRSCRGTSLTAVLQPSCRSQNPEMSPLLLGLHSCVMLSAHPVAGTGLTESTTLSDKIGCWYKQPHPSSGTVRQCRPALQSIKDLWSRAYSK